MEVVTCAFVVGIAIYLNLSLYLFFCPHHDSYANSLGVLQVLLLLDDCLASKQTGLDIKHV